MIQADSETNRFPPSAVASNVGEFLHDLLELGELQIRLFQSDAKKCFEKVRAPLALLILAAVLLLGTVPILLVALACGLVQLGMPYWSAFLVAAMVGGLAAVSMLLLAKMGFRSAKDGFDRSRIELETNLKWLKRTLSHRQAHSARSSSN